MSYSIPSKNGKEFEYVAATPLGARFSSTQSLHVLSCSNRNCRHLLAAPYPDQLAKLNWWLLPSNVPLALPERVADERDKLQVLAEVAEISKRYLQLVKTFSAYALLGWPRLKRSAIGAIWKSPGRRHGGRYFLRKMNAEGDFEGPGCFDWSF